MKTLIATAILVVASVDAAETQTSLTSRMTGTWSCVNATINGKPLSDTSVKKLHLTMTTTRYKTERNGEVLFDSTYRLDITKSPVHINLIGTRRSDWERGARHHRHGRRHAENLLHHARQAASRFICERHQFRSLPDLLETGEEVAEPPL